MTDDNMIIIDDENTIINVTRDKLIEIMGKHVATKFTNLAELSILPRKINVEFNEQGDCTKFQLKLGISTRKNKGGSLNSTRILYDRDGIKKIINKYYEETYMCSGVFGKASVTTAFIPAESGETNNNDQPAWQIKVTVERPPNWLPLPTN